MNKNFVFAFLAFPSLLASFLGSRQGLFIVQTQTQAVTPPAQASAPISPVGSDTSLNWAGYVTTGGAFTSVGASWAIPQSTSTSGALSADATWVGIGGITSADLIQAGTQTVIQNGVPTLEAWYEVLPASSVQVPLTVNTGDRMTVSVAQESSSTWQVSFNDATTGQSYEISVPYASSLSSAEWIEEMPSDTHNFVSLDNFGTLSFDSAFAVRNGTSMTPSALGAQPMTMITNAGRALAAPSSLGADGASFTVTRSAAVASAVPVTVTISRGQWSRRGLGAESYTPRPQVPPQQSRSRSETGSGNGRFRNFGNGLHSVKN